jgi:hypothetical protein
MERFCEEMKPEAAVEIRGARSAFDDPAYCGTVGDAMYRLILEPVEIIPKSCQRLELFIELCDSSVDELMDMIAGRLAAVLPRDD